MRKKKVSLFVLSSLSICGVLFGLTSCVSGEPTPDVDNPGQNEQTFTVVLNSNGGSEMPTLTYKGTALSLPTPTKDGYMFGGWYDNAGLSGNPVSSPYTPTADVTLYASWVDASTITVYYGADGNYEEYLVELDSTVTKSELPGYEEDKIVKGYTCPFIDFYFGDRDGTITTTAVPDTFVASEAEYYIYATYDESSLPKEQNLTDMGDGFYQVTGNVNRNLYDGEITDPRGVYEADIKFPENSGITGGAIGIAWRGTFNNVDKSYEANSYYVSVQLGLDIGTLQVCQVNSDFKQLKGSKPATLPQEFQDKIASMKAGSAETFHMKIADNGIGFKVWVDGVLLYDVENPDPKANPNGSTYDPSVLTGVGFGVRASKAASKGMIGNFKYTPASQVTLDANGGSLGESESTTLDYVYGENSLPTPKKDGAIFGGWYTDQDCKTEFNTDEPLNGKTTIYAKWIDTVNLTFKIITGFTGEMPNEEPVYTEFKQSVKISEAPAIDLDNLPLPDGLTEIPPVPFRDTVCPFANWTLDGEKVSGLFTFEKGEYTFVADYDYSKAPKYQNYTVGEDGYYEITGNVNWGLYDGEIAENGAGIYEADVKFDKDVNGGAVGIAWRGDFANQDKSYEAGSNYVAAQIDPKAGYIQVGAVVDGAFKQIKGSKAPFENLPEGYQKAFNAYKKDKTYPATFHMTVKDNGTGFRVYVNDILVFDTANPDPKGNPEGLEYDASMFTGREFGVRASSGAKASKIGNFLYKKGVKITFNTRGGDPIEPLENYVYGELPTTTKSGIGMEGWYLDENLTKKVDPSNFEPTEDITLYAKYNEAVTVTFTVNGKTFKTLTFKPEDDSKEIDLDSIKPEDISEARPFLHWNLNGAKVTGKYTVGGADLNFVAVFRKEVNQTQAFTLNEEMTEVTFTGNSSFAVMTQGYDDVTECKGVYEADISVVDPKGAIGIAWRGDFATDTEKCYEKGCNYVSVQIGSSAGRLQVGSVLNGSRGELKGSKPANTTFPQAFQDKLAKIAAKEDVDFHFMVVDYGDHFVLYVDGEQVFDSALPDSSSTAKREYNPNDYQGTGFGWRSSDADSKMSNFKYTTLADAEAQGLIPSSK